MDSKKFIWVGTIVGSYIGSLVPLAWGGDEFSISGILFSGLGAIAGIYAGWKISQ